jgi:hypothetical protein
MRRGVMTLGLQRSRAPAIIRHYFYDLLRGLFQLLGRARLEPKQRAAGHVTWFAASQLYPEIILPDLVLKTKGDVLINGSSFINEDVHLSGTAGTGPNEAA